MDTFAMWFGYVAMGYCALVAPVLLWVEEVADEDEQADAGVGAEGER